MNIPKFKAKLAEKNIKINDLARLWECSRDGASRRANGHRAISLDEAQTFSKYANLTDAEKVEIFLG